MRLADCSACQIGDHANHQRVVQSVPEGMLGGAICPCKGECEKDREQRQRRFLEQSGLAFLFASTGKESE